MNTPPFDVTSLHQDPYYRRFRAEIRSIVRQQIAEVLAQAEAKRSQEGREEARPEHGELQAA